MENKYSRGSEWREWDLHVHTPSSHLNNNFKSCTNNDFVQKCLDQKIAVIGLTNYFNFSKDDFTLKQELDKQNITVFLNLELRLTYQNKDDQCCDLHIIFSNELSKDTVQTFLSNLTVKVNGTEKKADKLSSQEDFENATVEFEHLLQTLKDESLNLKDKYLLGFLSRGHGNSRSSTQYEQITKKCDFIIHSSDSQDNIDKDKEFWLQENKPLLQSSDAHELDDIGNKFTWIKADTTFEGLKQIVYEPEERVRIQADNPSFDFDKPFFEKVKIDEEITLFEKENVTFQKHQSIPLNKNLVTFIGGRGTGKSLFLKYLGSRFQKIEDKPFKNSDKFIVNYQKENKKNGDQQEFKGDKNNLEFVFIEQSKIKNITDGDGLKNEIKKLLGLEDLKFSQELSEEIEKILNKTRELKKWFKDTDENSNLINTEEYYTKIKTENEKLLKTITTQSNKEKLEKYTGNVKNIERYKNQIERIENLKDKLEKHKEELNQNIRNINAFFDNQEFKIPNVDFQKQDNILKNQKENLEKQQNTKQQQNEDIKSDFAESGFKGDLTTLLSNAKTYQEKIEQSEKKIKYIKDKETKLNELKTKRSELGKSIQEEYERHQSALKKKWENLLQDKDTTQKEIIGKLILGKDIQLEVSIKFDEDKFYKLIHDEVDKRSYRSIGVLKEKFKISSFDNWVNYFGNDLDSIIEDEHFSEFIQDIFFDLQTRNQYIQVLPQLTYQNKTIDKLSAGQKGTLYLRLQLATNTFSTPIIFDQPEDDLDNKFIIDELVPLLKDFKKYRQIIIATHNANLVVGADAEQVVVANNEGEKLSYTSGSIENRDIKNKICEILEGGKDAFNKRKQKYNLV